MFGPYKWRHQLPPWARVSWLGLCRSIVFMAGAVIVPIIPFAIIFTWRRQAGLGALQFERGDWISALLILLIMGVGGCVSLAVFELIRYLIRKRRAK